MLTHSRCCRREAAAVVVAFQATDVRTLSVLLLLFAAATVCGVVFVKFPTSVVRGSVVKHSQITVVPTK